MGRTACPRCGRAGRCCGSCAQFHNVLIYVLLGAAVVTGALQHWVDTGVILAVVLANAVIGFLQEGKAEAAMAAIREMLAPRAAVLRDGAPGDGGRRRPRARRHRAAGGGRQGARRPAGDRGAGPGRAGGDPDRANRCRWKRAPTPVAADAAAGRPPLDAVVGHAGHAGHRARAGGGDRRRRPRSGGSAGFWRGSSN